jgi:hypothetical protein
MGYDATPEENRSVCVQDIPAVATYADFLNTVRGGKVYIYHMDPPNDDYPTQAAKLVFFSGKAATTYLRQTFHGGIFVLGELIRASWNRVLQPPLFINPIATNGGSAPWPSAATAQTRHENLRSVVADFCARRCQYSGACAMRSITKGRQRNMGNVKDD